MCKSKKNKTLAKPEPPPRAQSQSDFTHALTRVAVAQICQSVGYKSANSSALETLTTVAALYLKTLTTLAASNANRFGRTECNLLDIVVALEDLQSVKGFKGGSEVGRPLLESWVLGDVVEFVGRVDEIPFAQGIRRLKDESFGVGIGIGSQDGVNGNHNVGAAVSVPTWLPRFPDSKTYYKEEGEDNDDKGRIFGSKEVLFPNGGVEDVSVSGGIWEEKVRKQGGCGGELRSDRVRVKFRIGAKRKKCGLEVERIAMGNGEVGVSSDIKERAWKAEEKVNEKEKEKKVYVRRGLLLKNGEKRTVQWRKEVL